MPSAHEPEISSFAWDKSRIQRVVSTTQGLIVNLNDRCAILISALALMGGCKLGHMPVHSDLFAHLSDTPKLSEEQDH
jgi:hypothetical protein